MPHVPTLGGGAPHPTLHRLQAGATYTSRFGREKLKLSAWHIKALQAMPSNGFLPRRQTFHSTQQQGTQSAARNDWLARQLSSTTSRSAQFKSYHRRPPTASSQPSSSFQRSAPARCGDASISAEPTSASRMCNFKMMGLHTI